MIWDTDRAVLYAAMPLFLRSAAENSSPVHGAHVLHKVIAIVSNTAIIMIDIAYCNADSVLVGTPL